MPLVRNLVTTDPPPAVPVNAPASAVQPGGLEAQRVQTLQLLRCIESLAQFTGHAASILKDLHAQVQSAAVQSSSSLATRTADLATATSTLQFAPVDAYLTARPIRLCDPTPSPLFGFLTRATRPASIHSSLAKCTAPPQLDLLDPHRDDGKKCMSLYSNPEFFAEEWRKVMAKEDEDRRKKKKARKQKQKEEKQMTAGANGKDSTAPSLTRNKSFRGPKQPVGTGTASRASVASNADGQAASQSSGSVLAPAAPVPTNESSLSLARASQPSMPRSESANRMQADAGGANDSMALPPPPPPPMDGPGMPRVPSNLGALDASALPPPPPPSDAFAGVPPPPPPMLDSTSSFAPPPPPNPPASGSSGAPPPPPPPPPSIGVPPPPSSTSSGPTPPPPPPPIPDASAGGAPSLAALVLQAPKLRPAAARAAVPEPSPKSAGDGIDSVLTSIKAGGFQLRKVETPASPPPKKSPVEEYGNDVAGILMRRAAIEMSDSDEDEGESDDDDDW